MGWQVSGPNSGCQNYEKNGFMGILERKAATSNDGGTRLRRVKEGTATALTALSLRRQCGCNSADYDVRGGDLVLLMSIRQKSGTSYDRSVACNN